MEKVKITCNFINSKEPTVIDIDATISERHSLKNKVTRFPIEDGSTITDNSSPEPQEIELEGIISNFPLSLINSLISGVAGIAGGAIGSAFGSKLLGAGVTGIASYKLPGLMGMDSSTRVNLAKDIFNKISEQRIFCNIYTPIGVYENMLMQKVDIDRTSKTATGLYFKASFIKAEIVSSETVPVKAGVRGANKVTDNGKIVSKQVTDSKETRSKSWLLQLSE